MNTRRTLWLGFATLIGVLLLIVVPLTIRLDTLDERIDDVADVSGPSHEAASEMETHVHELASDVFSYLLSGDEAHRASFAESRKAFDAAYRDFVSVSRSGPERELAEEIARQFARYVDEGEQLMAGRANRRDPQSRRRFIQLNDDLDDLIDDELKRATRGELGPARAEVDDAVDALWLSLLVLLVSSLFIALGTSVVVSRAVLKAEETLRTTLRSIGDAVIATDAHSRITFINPVAAQLTGWPESEAVGRRLEEVFRIIDEHTREPAASPVERALKQGRITSINSRTILIARDGTERPISDSAAPLRSRSILGAVLVFRDVSEQRTAEREIVASNQRFQALVRATAEVVWTTAPDGRVVEDSPTWRAFTGQTLEQWQGHGWLDAIHPDDRERVSAEWREAVTHRGVFETDYRVQHVKGGYRWTTVRAVPILDRNGAVAEWVGMNIDVTDRREAEDRRRQTERYLASQQRWLEAVLNQLPIPLVFVEPETALVTFSNQAADSFAGGRFPRDSWTDQLTLAHRYLDASGQPISEHRLPSVRVARGERVTNFEMEWHIRGVARTIILTGDIVPAMHGHPAMGVLAFQDISRLKRAEQILRFSAEASANLAELVEAESALQRLIDQAVPEFADWAAADLLEPDGTVRRLAAAHRDPNKAGLARELAERFPLAPDAKLGAPAVIRRGQSQYLAEVTDDVVRAAAQTPEHLRLLQELGVRSYICVPIGSKGRVRGALTFMLAESGRSFDRRAVRAAEDLGKRAFVAMENAALYRQLQDEGRRKDEFLATLAHELRNPLAPIRTGLEVLERLADNPTKAHDIRAMMLRQTQQMTRLIDDLLDVSRITRGKLALRKEPIDLAAAVRSAVEASKPLLDAREHRLTVELPAEPVHLEADLTRLAQVFSNLLNNAARYTRDAGTIRLRAWTEDGDVVVAVSDTGVGIPAHMLDRIFDLFAQIDRTYEHGYGGLGIGLTLVRHLVEMHGGRVVAHSEGEGRGSEFRVYLPMASEGPAELPPRPKPEEALAPERVLIVDDNEEAAEMLSMLVALLGAEVRSAHDGEEGVREAEAFRPQVVLMDLGMPQVDGYEAARRIRATEWGQNVMLVALTGWGQAEDKRRSREAGFDHHLVKPADLDAIETVFRSWSRRR